MAVHDDRSTSLLGRPIGDPEVPAKLRRVAGPAFGFGYEELR